MIGLAWTRSSPAFFWSHDPARLRDFWTMTDSSHHSRAGSQCDAIQYGPVASELSSRTSNFLMDQCSVIDAMSVRGPFSTLRGQTVGGGNVRILDAAPLISATAMVKVFGCRQAYENLHLPGHRRTTTPIPEAVVRRAVCWRLSAPVERSGRGHIQSTAEHSVLYLITSPRPRSRAARVVIYMADWDRL